MFVVFISLISIFFVYVKAQVPTGSAGHEGSGVWISVGGTEKDLQVAIDANDFDSPGASITLTDCEPISWVQLDWYHPEYGYGTGGGSVWNSCGDGKVISSVRSWKYSNPSGFCSDLPPSNCGELMIISVNCCSLSI